MYMPTLARFASRDPLPEPGEPLMGVTSPSAETRLYPYTYVRNNPKNDTDPSGRLRESVPPTQPGACNPAIKLGDAGYGCDCCNFYGPSRTKCDFINKYGVLPVNRIPAKPQPDVKITTNPDAKFCGKPGSDQYFGPDGLDPSVGVIVQIPDGKGGFSVLQFHLSGCTSPADLGKFSFPAGSHGVICGGDNSTGSNCTYGLAEFFMRSKNIKVDGIIDRDGCFVGNDGRYYGRAANRPSTNDPPCP